MEHTLDFGFIDRTNVRVELNYALELLTYVTKYKGKRDPRG